MLVPKDAAGQKRVENQAERTGTEKGNIVGSEEQRVENSQYVSKFAKEGGETD
jgi:hypothetical protein